LRKSPMIAIIITLVAIVLYWTPLPSIGGVIIGGYPWIAPEAAKPIFIGIGVVSTIALLILSALTLYFSKKIEEIETFSETPSETTTSLSEGHAYGTGTLKFNPAEEGGEEDYDF